MIPNEQKNGEKGEKVTMEINRTISFKIDLSSRKYKMIALECGILTLILIISQIVVAYWPAQEPLSSTIDNYVLYMLLGLLEVFLICMMAFIGGYWFAIWRFDKNARISEDLEMEPIP